MITFAHSPDTDDYFFVWPISFNRIDCEELEFSFVTHDTETLNRLACEAKYDVSAVSVGAIPFLAEHYAILPYGASIGRGYGPVVVAKQSVTLEELRHLTVGIPGEMTTAARVFRQLVPQAKVVELSIDPFSLMFEALEQGRVDALVLIHEGQLSYRSYGLKLVVDLGKWWTDETGLPLALGVNVVRRSLGLDTMNRIARVLRRSIDYSMNHRDESLEQAAICAGKRSLDRVARDRIDTYLSLYANQDALGLDSECREAITKLTTSLKPNVSGYEEAPTALLSHTKTR